MSNTNLTKQTSIQQSFAKRPLEPRKRAIIIGASSGIGAALVHQLARQGYLVAALARREDLLFQLCDNVNSAIPDSTTAYVHDVTEFTAVPHLFQTIVQNLGGLDLIIYVAGAQPAVATTEYSFDKDKTMISSTRSQKLLSFIQSKTEEIVQKQLKYMDSKIMIYVSSMDCDKTIIMHFN